MSKDASGVSLNQGEIAVYTIKTVKMLPIVVQFALHSSCASVNQQIIAMMPLRLCGKCCTSPGFVDMRCDQSGSSWPTGKRKSSQCLC